MSMDDDEEMLQLGWIDKTTLNRICTLLLKEFLWRSIWGLRCLVMFLFDIGSG